MTQKIAGAPSRAARIVWWWLRQVSGDAAYENYCRRSGQATGLSRRQFYLEKLERKYARVSRCC